MRNIQKHPEPKSLTQHRCNLNTDYDNYAEKDDLRRELSKWNGDNGENLEPFCQVVVYYLRKKIDKKK